MVPMEYYILSELCEDVSFPRCLLVGLIKELNGQYLGKKRLDGTFKRERGIQGAESRYLGDFNKTLRKLDVQNEKKVKSHVLKHRK